MSDNLTLEIYSPTKQLPPVTASEVVLPAVDGEVGVLAGHENIVGQLGTGPLKYVSGNNDFWLMVSSGAYQVLNGKLVITAEVVEDTKNIDVPTIQAHVAKLEKEVEGKDTSSPEYIAAHTEYLREKARLEVHRRVAVVN